MAGLRELMPVMAAALESGWSITNPTTALGTARIAGSTDATYGTVGWVPPLDSTAFAVLYGDGAVDEAQREPNRIWATHAVRIFLGLAHADTPAVAENYNDLANAWADEARQVIARNFYLTPASLTLWPTAGDVRWQMTGWKLQPRQLVLGVPFYGVEVVTRLRVIVAVSYAS